MFAPTNPPQSSPPPPHYVEQPEATTDLESTTPTLPHRHHSALIPGFHNAPPFLTFLRRDWIDILAQFLCFSTATLLYEFVPPIMPRYFPLYAGVETSAWGMKHGHPYVREYIDTFLSAAVSFGVPAVVMGAIGLWGTRDFEDTNAALMGLGYALSTSTLFTSLLKIFIGGLRPHFLSICNPSSSSSPGIATHPVFYTATQVCTGTPKKLKEAQMSFPSGHANAAFAGFGFLALYLNAHFKILGRGRGFGHTYRSSPPPSSAASFNHESELSTSAFRERRKRHWKHVLFVAPWLVAVVIALSKIRDMWHHPIDVVFGAITGTLFAFMAYRMCYWSVWDGRNNHVPRVEGRVGGEKVE